MAPLRTRKVHLKPLFGIKDPPNPTAYVEGSWCPLVPESKKHLSWKMPGISKARGGSALNLARCMDFQNGNQKIRTPTGDF